MTSTVLLLALLAGATPTPVDSPQVVEEFCPHVAPAAPAFPMPAHPKIYAPATLARPQWKNVLIYRQWIPRYTIHEGYNYVRPVDYYRALDYPWHAPRSGWASGPAYPPTPVILPIDELAPPPELPQFEEVYPDHDIPAPPAN